MLSEAINSPSPSSPAAQRPEGHSLAPGSFHGEASTVSWTQWIGIAFRHLPKRRPWNFLPICGTGISRSLRGFSRAPGLLATLATTPVAILEFDPAASRARSTGRGKPVMSAVQIAVEGLAERAPAEFLGWADASSRIEILAVQQLIADGYKAAAPRLASNVLDWLLGDQRRFQLGSRYGHRQTTMALVAASAPHWSNEDIGRLERAVLGYQPATPEHVTDPERRRTFAGIVRATRKDLLQSVGVERLSPQAHELVVVEERALGDRFTRSMTRGEGGYIRITYGSRCDGQGQGS